jgi:ATP-dependent protease ClpP protease subunit
MMEVDPTFTLKRLKTLLKCDTVLTAQRALELGLIDEIIEKRV